MPLTFASSQLSESLEEATLVRKAISILKCSRCPAAPVVVGGEGSDAFSNFREFILTCFECQMQVKILRDRPQVPKEKETFVVVCLRPS